MNIKIFPKGSGEQLSANFKAYEFDCPCDNCTETKIDLDLVEILQKNRDHFGKPISPNAYRCPRHNAEIPNAAKASKHMQGMAADFSIEGESPLEIAAYNESIGVKGIGLYDTFVHVDDRESKAFWYSHKQLPRTTFGGLRDPQESQEAEKGTIVPVSVDLPILMNGDSGDTVEAVQILLKGKGYNLGKFGPNEDGIDGHFGAATENAVTAFQEAMELENRNGTVGGPEWRALLGL